ncbi:MAG: DMT family transporter [Pseudomonadota bacterium]|nr:DMT family transporter [Pseudomonadota bacterium]
MTAVTSARNTQAGIMLMIGAALTFGVQDGLSRLLAETYGLVTVIAIRFWFFALFVLAFSATRPGGIRRAAITVRPWLQTARGILLITQICTAVYGFTIVGLVGYQVIFASYPLMIAALSVPFLGERVGWRRWLAIAAGFGGVAIALDPRGSPFGPQMIIPLVGAIQFAAYGILTRIAARHDSAGTSFFWTGMVGALAMSLMVPFAWNPLQGGDWMWMAMLCLTSTGGHFLLIKAFDLAEASVLQPFAYFGIATSAAVGFIVFDDAVTASMLTGGAIIIAAGLFTFWRERVQARATARDAG